MQVRIHLIPSMNFIFDWVQRCLYWRDLLTSLGSLSEFAFHVKAFVCVYTAIHMQKTTTGHLMTMHVMFSEFMRQRLCTLCFPNSCAKDYLTAGGCRECHSSAANEDGYDILWYRSGTLDRRTCLIMSFLFRDGMWLTQEPPCWLMIWTWFHLFIKDDGLRNPTRRVQPHRHCSSLPKKSTVCVCLCLCLCLCVCPRYRDLAKRPVKRSCTEILPGHLFWRPCTETLHRDPVAEILPRGLLQRACQQSSYRDLVQRSHKEILPRDLL